jgi:hypothetical protein
MNTLWLTQIMSYIVILMSFTAISPSTGHGATLAVYVYIVVPDTWRSDAKIIPGRACVYIWNDHQFLHRSAAPLFQVVHVVPDWFLQPTHSNVRLESRHRDSRWRLANNNLLFWPYLRGLGGRGGFGGAVVTTRKSKRLSHLRSWVRFSLRTHVKESVNVLPNGVGFLRVLRFPPTGKVDRVG